MGGIIIEINGIDIKNYGAKLLSYSVGATATTLSYFSGKNMLYPIITDTEIKPRPLSITLVFKGKSRFEVITNISNFAAQLLKKCEIYLPDEYYYTCIMTSISESTEVVATEHMVTYQFDAVRHLPLESEILLKSGIFICRSNVQTECIYEVTTSQEIVTVNDITIQNAEGTTIIDGMKKTVTKNGANVYKNTDLISFPVLQTGVNQINISDNTSVKVSYYPTFV